MSALRRFNAVLLWWYTNRIRFDAMLRLFEEAGFETELRHVEQWAHLSLDRQRRPQLFGIAS